MFLILYSLGDFFLYPVWNFFIPFRETVRYPLGRMFDSAALSVYIYRKGSSIQWGHLLCTEVETVNRVSQYHLAAVEFLDRVGLLQCVDAERMEYGGVFYQGVALRPVVNTRLGEFQCVACMGVVNAVDLIIGEVVSLHDRSLEGPEHAPWRHIA